VALPLFTVDCSPHLTHLPDLPINIRAGSLCESFPLKISLGRYRRSSWQIGHPATIHDDGSVFTGAGMLSPHPLHQTAKSHTKASGIMNAIEEG
jgi:hypothetical protein